MSKIPEDHSKNMKEKLIIPLRSLQKQPLLYVFVSFLLVNHVKLFVDKFLFFFSIFFPTTFVRGWCEICAPLILIWKVKLTNHKQNFNFSTCVEFQIFIKSWWQLEAVFFHSRKTMRNVMVMLWNWVWDL